MRCHYCGNADTKVIDSRAMDDGVVIRRRRFCESCSERFTTFERVDMIPLAVIKRNGSRETFDSVKLLSGIIKSCNKRPATMEQMEGIVKDVELTLLNSMRKEVESKEIGELVMDRIKNIDEVAYVRFASVYRQFTDIDTFADELKKLLQEKSNKLT